jgi:hypothetical protein
MSCCSSLSVGGPLRLVLGLRPVAVLMVGLDEFLLDSDVTLSLLARGGGMSWV